MRFCLLLMAPGLVSITLVGCETKPPPPPTAAEAAQTPPISPPKGPENSRNVSDK